MKLVKSLLLLSIILSSLVTVAQNKGTISGIVIDSTRSIMVEAASVALYQKTSDKIYRITLSNNAGRFLIDNLPKNENLRLQISHQGYDIFTKNIIIGDAGIDLGKIHLTAKENLLNEVKILSPIRLNGDTIEFNADAFVLDSNAVAGDLLAKLPGIIIWGDNEITYNGKKINRLYVNGKEFFSTNANIALQNLPKNIVEKVQIFDTDKEKKDTKDVNVVLKKGKDKGVFGKLGSGAGTNKQYEGELVANLFNASNQISVGGIKNDINKPLNSVDQLLSNTTFGGVNLSPNYFSDLRKRGYQDESAYGMLFKHDFMNGKSDKMGNFNTLKVDLFHKVSNSNLEDISNTIWLTASEFDNYSNTKMISNSYQNNLVSEINYNLESNQRVDLNFLAKFEQRTTDNDLSRSRDGQINNIFTEERDITSNQGEERAFTFGSEINIKPPSKIGRSNLYDKVSVVYNMFYNPTSDVFNIEKSLMSSSDDFDDRFFSRASLIDRDLLDQKASVNIQKIFPRHLRGLLDISLAQTIKSSRNASNNNVSDSLKINPYLTFNEDNNRLSSTSSVFLRKKLVISELAGRYEKSLNLSVNLGWELIKDKISSSYIDRSLERSNSFILPTFHVNYLQSIANRYIKNINLSSNTSYKIPSIELIAPVIDSINLFNMTYGNKQLKNSRVNNFMLNYTYNSQSSTALNYNISVNLNYVEDAHIPFITYSADGRREVYFVNDFNRQSNYTASAGLRKAIKLNDKNNLAVKLSAYGMASKQGQYINDSYEALANLSYNGKLDLLFNFSDLFKVGVYQQLDYFQQNNKNSANFRSSTSDSNLSLAFKITKRASVTTNGSYLNVKNNNNSDAPFVWNLSASYRALEKSNLEIKLSALDILNNNTAIYTRTTSSYTTYGTSNIIRQYFMLNLSYYPRFF